MFKNKRGVEMMTGLIIFIILNLVFFMAMFAFVARTGSGVSFYEQAYAKEIALAIDSADPGTTIYLDVSKQQELFRKDLPGSVQITEDLVRVKLSEKKGYEFNYFSDYKVSKNFDGGGDKLILVLTISDE